MTPDEQLDAATQAVYDCPMPDGDQLCVLLHCSDYVDPRQPLGKQIKQVRELCRQIAKAALDAARQQSADHSSAQTQPIPPGSAP